LILVLPEFVKVNKLLIEEMLGLSKGDEMLVLTTPEAPSDVAESTQTYAESIGIKSYVLSVHPQAKGSPASKIITSIAKEVDGIYLLSGWGSLDFKEVVEHRTPLIYIAGAPGIDESLIRTMLGVEIRKLKEEAWKIADAFTDAKMVRITSRQGTDYTEEIAHIYGEALCGFACDPMGTPWEYVPPACPGIVETKKGTSNGKVVFDAYISGIGVLREPVTVYVDGGKITRIEGGRQAEQFKQLLESFDQSSFNFPAEWGIGTNPNAELVGPSGRILIEWERVRGTIHMGMGDLQPYPVHYKGKLINPEWKPALHHCDGMMWTPTVYLDDKLTVKDGFIQKL